MDSEPIKLKHLGIELFHSKIPFVHPIGRISNPGTRTRDYAIEEERYNPGDAEFVIRSFNKTGYPALDLFVGAVAEAMNVYDTLDRDYYKDKPFPLDAKINEFLGYYGLEYKDITSGLEIDQIHYDDFENCDTEARHNLFDSRAKIYLSALSAVADSKERPGLLKVINDISDRKINPIKKTEEDFVWDWVASNLRIPIRFDGAEFSIWNLGNKEINPESDMVLVHIKLKDGTEYATNHFTTPKMLREIADESAASDECPEIPYSFIIPEITPENIKKALDYHIKRSTIMQRIDEL